MTGLYTRIELTKYFFEALDMFNSKIDSNINKNNVLLEFFSPKNGVEVYENFCGLHFPEMLEEKYKEPGYFDSFGAQAFTNEKEYGVLIREDIDFSVDDLIQMFIHEISHLFCVKNEIEGGNFFDKYCRGSGVEDGMINAGYAIWREAIADIMADSIISDYAIFALETVRNNVKEYYNMLSSTNPDSKKAMSLIIAYIMISKEVAGTINWDYAEKSIKKEICIDDVLFIALLKQVFDQLHHYPFWGITPEFIMTLGETYLEILAHIMLRRIYE